MSVAARAGFEAALDTVAAELHGIRRICIGISGGPHSLGMLALCARLRETGALPADVRALHVDHGLHPEAAAWRALCERGCALLRVPFETCRVEVREAGDGPESAARRARYAAVAARLAEGEAFVTGHHAGDQAETVLLRALRGSGPRGMAGMRPRRALGRGVLVRPALGIDASVLEAAAADSGLGVAEDPSNLDPTLARGWLRTQLGPVLDARYPRWRDAFGRGANAMADAVEVLDEVAAGDLARCRDASLERALDGPRLAALSRARARLVVRALVDEAGIAMPPAAVVDDVLGMPGVAPDRQPVVAWPGGEFRRSGTLLALLAAPDNRSCPVEAGWRVRLPSPTQNGTTVSLPCGVLRFEPQSGPFGITVDTLATGRWELRGRRGGERLRLGAGRPRRSLKKLMTERRVPVWLRAWLPLVFRDDVLVAVPEIGVAPEVAAPEGGAALCPRWSEWPLDAG